MLKKTPTFPTAEQTAHQLGSNYTALTPTCRKTPQDPNGKHLSASLRGPNDAQGQTQQNPLPGNDRNLWV